MKTVRNGYPEAPAGKYDVEVLKKMMDVETRNIKSFMRFPDEEERLARMVATRRYLAALIENDGVKDDSFRNFENNWVGLCKMSYEAAAGADTSNWG